MELLLHSIAIDWPVLLPILICSILVVAVVINRFSFLQEKQKRCCFAYSAFAKRTGKKQS